MRVKERIYTLGNTRSINATFAEYYTRNQESFWNRTSNNPTLGEV